jgi:hypothetical protein
VKEAAARRAVNGIPAWAKAALAAAGILLLLVLLAAAPLRWPAYLDFQVLYHANMGLLRGIALYDHAGQVNMIAGLANVAPERVYVLPFPYPPWYALGTLWLALLPIEAAARVWLGVNLVLLIAATWLLSDGWSPWKRLLAAALPVFFLPVTGSLLVGQYGFPVLLGCALMLYSLRHEQTAWCAVAAALLTFKPHLGGLILLAALIHLWRRKDGFGRRTLLAIAAAAVLLFAVGFAADPAWPIHYARSLAGFRHDSGVTSCQLCSSLPVLISESLGRTNGLAGALAIAVVLLCGLAALWLQTHRSLLQEPEMLMSAAVLTVLLASPYLLKYDYLLLLVPLALLAGRRASFGNWLLLAVVFALPLLALVLPARQGDLVLILCTLALAIRLYLQKPALDVSSAAA